MFTESHVCLYCFDQKCGPHLAHFFVKIGSIVGIIVFYAYFQSFLAACNAMIDGPN